MGQKLSAMKYIRNNKRRIAVLVVSLGLCFVLIYLTNFLLMATEETFRVCTIDNAKNVQYAFLAGSSLGIDVDNLDGEEINQQYLQKNLELCEALKEHEDVEEVYYTQVLYNVIDAAIGSWSVEMPLVEKSQLKTISDHIDVEICEGRMPENPGEIVLDKAAMSNGGYELNDYFDQESWTVIIILDMA